MTFRWSYGGRKEISPVKVTGSGWEEGCGSAEAMACDKVPRQASVVRGLKGQSRA